MRLNGLMLGMMYALVAVGFTLFFGVLDVIKFSHGDVLMVGAFAGFATYLGLNVIGVTNPWLQVLILTVVAVTTMAVLGAAIARWLVMPLRSAPALNTLLITLMLGTVLREAVRLFFPEGLQSQAVSRACCRRAALELRRISPCGPTPRCCCWPVSRPSSASIS